MNIPVKIRIENTDQWLEVEMGTSLREVAERLTATEHPYLAAEVNHRIKELHYRIYKPATIRFIDITSFEGLRVYHRTAWFMLQKVVRSLYPDRKLRIRHSMGPSGFYCEVEGIEAFSRMETDTLRRRMRELAADNLPIIRRKLPTDEVRALFEAQGEREKIALLETRPRLYSTVHLLDDLVGYFYGALAPSTHYVDNFDIQPYHNGFYLALPLRNDPSRLYSHVEQEKMTGIFREYQSWMKLVGTTTVGEMNSLILRGYGNGLILVAEAFHERKFAEVADRIAEANRTRGTRMVLISGPSSSGKTTSAKRLAIQLGVVGLHPVLISLDDYFVEREKTPRDEKGDYDYEALEAIDLALFNDHLRRLMQGESVDIPRYNFITGRREWHETPLTLDERSILIVEGIHGLNPGLTPELPDDLKFKIYVSCFTSVGMDNLSRISTTDNRLLRRMTRDSAQRGTDALNTLRRWPSVRRGEERHIFPYQEEADVMLNSSLFYELAILQPHAERLLRQVPDTAPEYAEAQRLLKFLDNFTPLDAATIPPTSILREFIGGSAFTY